jgi:hypothetical protein
MTEHKFVTLQVSRNDDAEVYELAGLPAGEGFKDPNNYVRLTASWLKVNDVGFAAPSAEFGEHDHTIVVEQSTEGGGANIKL